MKRKRILGLALSLVMVVGLAGCGKQNSHLNSSVNTKNTSTSKTDNASVLDKGTANSSSVAKSEVANVEKHYPVEIDNFGKKTVYEKAPERVIAMDYNAASTLVALGLKDKIIASREAGLLSIDDVAEEYRDDVKKIEIPEGYLKSPLPPLEVTLSLKPDFILMDSFYFNVPDLFGEYKDYTDNGINILVTEGSMDKKPELDDMYVDIKNLGKIFDVEDTSQELCKKIEDRFNEIKSKVDISKKYKVMGFDSGDDKPIVAAGKSLENLLIEEAGAENIFSEVDKQFATVGWEDVIAKNPDYIILHETPEDKGAKNLIKILKSNKELANVNAVKNEKFIVVPLRYMFSGIYTVDAFDLIVQGLKK